MPYRRVRSRRMGGGIVTGVMATARMQFLEKTVGNKEYSYSGPP